MGDRDKSKAQLVKEARQLRRQVAELQKSKAQYRAWFDSLADPIVVFDQETRCFLDCNQAALDRYGYTLEELRTMTFRDLHPPDELELDSSIDGIDLIEPHHDTHVTKDGERIAVEVHTDQIEYEGRDALISAIRDVAERKRAERALKQYAAQLELLNDIGAKIAAVLELDLVLERAARLVQETFGYDNVALLTLDREQDELVVKAICGAFAHLLLPNHRLKLGQGMVGWAGSHGETLLANDVAAEPRYVRLYPGTALIRSELCVPIRVGEEVVGVLDIQSPQLNAFSENDVIVMETLASQIAIAIANARLYEAAQEELAERKRADTALWESEKRFRSLAETASDAIIIFDSREAIVFWNQAARDFFGYSSGETVRMALASIMPKQFYEVFQREVKRVVSTGASELIGKAVEVTGVRKDGSEFPLELSLSTWKARKETFITAIARDITERKRTEDRLTAIYTLGQKLVLSKETAEIAQSVLDATWQVLQLPTCSLWLADENQGAAIRQGHRRGAGPPKLTSLPLDDERGIVAAVIRSGEPIYVPDVSQEPRYVNGGSLSRSELCVPLKAGGRIIGAVNAESKQLDGFSPADRQLLEVLANTAAVALENARLYRETQQLAAFNEDIIQTMTEGVALEDADGRFTFVNPALASMLGYTPGELVGQHWTVAVPPDQQSVIEAADERRAHGEADRYELELVRKDGTRFPALISGAPRFEQGRFVGTLATCTDISEQKRAERALERRAAQLALINDIGGKVAAVLELDSVLDRAARLVQENFGYHHVALFALDPGQGVLTMKARAGDFAHLFPPDHQLRLGQGMVGWVGLHGERLLADDVSVEPRYVNLYPDVITTRSELSVPIRVGKETMGVLDVQSPELDAFGEHDVMVMETLADQIAIAIENARLYEAAQQELAERKRAQEEAQRRAAQAALIYEIGQRVSSELELDELLSAIVTAICEAFGHHSVALLLVDEEAECLVLQSIAGGYADQFTGDVRLDFGEGIIGHAAATGKPYLSGDVSQDPHYVRHKMEETRSELAVPIRSGQKVIGVLDLQSDRCDAFDAIDVTAMEALSTQIASAIENARLFEETHSRAEELATLNELGQALTTRLSVDEVLEEAYRQISRLLDTSNFGIVLYDPEKHELNFAINISESKIDEELVIVPADQGISGYVVNRRTSVLIQENTNEWGKKMGVEAVGEPALCWLGVPLIVGDQVLGMIAVQSFTDPHAYDEHDRDLLASIASQVAIALQNAYLFEETRSRAQRLAVLNRIARLASATLDLDELLETVYEEIAPAFQPDGAFIALYDEQTKEMDLRFLTDQGVRQPSQRRQLGPGIISIIIAEKRPIISRTEEEFSHLLPAGEQFGTSGMIPASWLGVPMLVGERVVGVINVQAYHANAWDEEDELLLFTIADQVAVAIENVRLLAEARSRAEELAVLNELGQALTARLSVGEVLEETHRQTSRLMDTANFYIGLYDPEKHEINIALEIAESEMQDQATAISADQGIGGYMITHRTPVLIPDNAAEWYEKTGVQQVGPKGSLSWLGAPLMVGDRVLGVMGLQSYTIPRLYDEHDLDLLTSIASQAAIAIQNAFLFEETRSRAQRLAVVNRVAKVAGATLHLDDLMEAMYEEIAPAFQPEGFFIALYDEEAEELDYRFFVDEGIRHPPERHPLGAGLSSIVIARKAPLIIRDFEREPEHHSAALLMGTGRRAASWLGVPMLVGERVVGVINVQAYHPNAWGEEDELLLFTIADQVAVAIENARLYEAVQRELIERERAEEALEHKAQELARSNAELEQFAYVASHDLQEPLRMVRSYLQLLERRYKDQLDQEAGEFIWFAVDGATRMQALINDLLTYSRVTTRAKPLEPTDCAAILDLVLTDLKIAIEESDAIVTHDSLPTVLADATQLRQVFQNLIGNGIKFRKEGTRPEIHVGVEQQDGEWVFSVRDNGIGIDSQHSERVFMIFQRLHSREEYEGTGLGLAVCKKIVERHGGRIWVESKPGQGATFRFTIPCTGEDLS